MDRLPHGFEFLLMRRTLTLERLKLLTSVVWFLKPLESLFNYLIEIQGLGNIFLEIGKWEINPPSVLWIRVT
jgi:hypothetical protein